MGEKTIREWMWMIIIERILNEILHLIAECLMSEQSTPDRKKYVGLTMMPEFQL